MLGCGCKERREDVTGGWTFKLWGNQWWNWLSDFWWSIPPVRIVRKKGIVKDWEAETKPCWKSSLRSEPKWLNRNGQESLGTLGSLKSRIITIAKALSRQRNKFASPSLSNKNPVHRTWWCIIGICAIFTPQALTDRAVSAREMRRGPLANRVFETLPYAE